jgi:hypothetical protein
MSDFDELYGSKFLSAVDVKAPISVTIENVATETFQRLNGQPSQTKAVLFFRGGKKGLVVNKGNAATLAEAFGKPFAGWVGNRVTIKAEQTTFGGKLVQGLRVYPINQAVSMLPKVPPPGKNDDMSDEIPW